MLDLKGFYVIIEPMLFYTVIRNIMPLYDRYMVRKGGAAV